MAEALLNGDSGKCYRIGWVTYDSFPKRWFSLHKRNFDNLEPFTRMRTGNVAKCINSICNSIHNELYDPRVEYDIVIFQKIVDKRYQAEAQKIKQYGGRIIFDANVNYYEIWGEYNILGTKPTPEQQQEAIWMTQHADLVVGDSSYIASIAQKFNTCVTWIPDNVNLAVYNRIKHHCVKKPIVLVWSGIAKKAKQLLLIKDVLRNLDGFELVLVSDKLPETMRELKQVIPCRFVHFSDHRYAQTLVECDIIISPKYLCNGYEMGHTEYKITLGMAGGLPAVSSPQLSYIEAISYKNGGIIARTNEEWFQAFKLLANDHKLRSEMGARARQTVIERYSTPVIAEQYLKVIKNLLTLKPNLSSPLSVGTQETSIF